MCESITASLAEDAVSAATTGGQKRTLARRHHLAVHGTRTTGDDCTWISCSLNRAYGVIRL